MSFASLSYDVSYVCMMFVSLSVVSVGLASGCCMMLVLTDLGFCMVSVLAFV